MLFTHSSGELGTENSIFSSTVGFLNARPPFPLGFSGPKKTHVGMKFVLLSLCVRLGRVGSGSRVISDKQPLGLFTPVRLFNLKPYTLHFCVVSQGLSEGCSGER